MSDHGPAEGASDERETEWRFALDEVGPEAETETVEADPIEPEEISLEHAGFVALGVALALGVLLTAL